MFAASAFIGSVLFSINILGKVTGSDDYDTTTAATTTTTTTIVKEKTPAVLPPAKEQGQDNMKKEEKIAQKVMKNEPSVNGHHFGNFHEYYTFHKCEDRCKSLSDHFFKDIWEHTGKPSELYLLDVGCNEGDLTYEVLQEAQKQLPNVVIKAIGTDLDEELIERAKEKFTANNHMLFAALNIMEGDSLTNFMAKHKISSFGLVSCFSITMWIHMNHGDEGLKHFLKLVGTVSNCSVLLEPQLWKSYRKANERCRRRGIPELPYFKTLKIKDIKQSCIDVYSNFFGMTLQQHDDETPGWNRPLMLFSFKP